MTRIAQLQKMVDGSKRYPWLFAFISAAGGALWQWSITNEQERQKQEAALIERAMNEQDKRAAASNLRVLLDLNLVNERHYPSLTDWATNADKIPGFGGAALRDGLVTIMEVKSVLKKLGNYPDGPIDNKDDPAFRRAIARFQVDHDLDADGLLGPKTLRVLMKASPEDFGLK